MPETNKNLPKILDSETVFRGRIFYVTVDTVQEGDVTYKREVVHHPGSAVILFVSPGFCEEKMWLFLATELSETRQRLEDDEILEIVRVPFSEALEMITDGEIQDAKTIIGLMLAAPRVGPPMLEIDYPAV